MAKSLQEQLLKAGLVSTHKAKQIQSEKNKQAKRPPQAQKSNDDAKSRALQAQTEKAERDREISRQRQEEAERKAIAAQIKQLVEQNRVASGDGEIGYQFAEGNKVKKIYLTEAQRSQLLRGQLAVVKCEKRYELVPAEAAEKIRARDASAVLVWITGETPAVEKTEDPYAAYQIPDDLVW